MTNEEYLDKKYAIQDKIAKAKVELEELDKQHVEEADKFPMGAKVKITTYEEVKYGFVCGYYVDGHGRVRPNLLKPKKDGTPSKNAHIYVSCLSKLELC